LTIATNLMIEDSSAIYAVSVIRWRVASTYNGHHNKSKLRSKLLENYEALLNPDSIYLITAKSLIDVESASKAKQRTS